MEFVNFSEPVYSNQLGELCRNLAFMLRAASFFLVRGVIVNQHQQLLIFTSKIFFSRSFQIMDVIWELNVSMKVIKIRIVLQGIGTLQSQDICTFLMDNRAEVSEFVYQINNLKLKDEQGLFYFMQQTGEIGFRARIQGLNFLSSQTKQMAWIQSRIKTYIKIFSEQLQMVLCYYKLPGFSDTQMQRGNNAPLKRIIEKIKFLRQLYQRRRGQRMQQSQSIYSIPTPFHIFQSFGFLYGCNYMQGMMPQAGLTTSEMISRLCYEFNQQKNLLLNDLEKYQVQGFDPILTTIEIKQRAQEKIIDSGGYAEIFSGIYSFIPQLSINKTVNCLIDTQNYLKTGYHLVKKKGNHKKVEPSLKNQFNFLYYMRNKVCPYFAKYYCNNTVMPFSDGEVYLQYYPNSLAECRLKEDQKMKVMQDICMGLLFLNYEGIIHRDLKEFNIMVDRQKRGRIIDFGSVASISGSNRFKPIDDKIRTTEGYFIPYGQATKLVPELVNRVSKYQYYNHRCFDQYSLGRIFFNQFYLDHIVNENHFLRYNLRYLCQKCFEVNPNDRLNLEEIVIFLRQLMMFSLLRRQVWKFSFDEKCKAHTFGVLQGEKQMKISEMLFLQEYKKMAQ